MPIQLVRQIGHSELLPLRVDEIRAAAEDVLGGVLPGVVVPDARPVRNINFALNSIFTVKLNFQPVVFIAVEPEPKEPRVWRRRQELYPDALLLGPAQGGLVQEKRADVTHDKSVLIKKKVGLQGLKH